MGRNDNSWKYCKNTTTEHLIFQTTRCNVTKIQTLLDKDSKEYLKQGRILPSFSSNIVVIPVDCIMKGTREQNRKSVDIAFGIAFEGIKKAILLVELKLNTITNKTFLKEDRVYPLIEKIQNSINLLGTSPSIHNGYIFIYPDEDKVTARQNWTARTIEEIEDIEKKNILLNFKYMTIEDFRGCFFEN